MTANDVIGIVWSTMGALLTYRFVAGMCGFNPGIVVHLKLPETININRHIVIEDE